MIRVDAYTPGGVAPAVTALLLNRGGQKMSELAPAANGVAIFACSAGELFEAVQMSAPIDEHWLYIGDTPHLYPLARLESRYPRYAVVVADTNTARIFVSRRQSWSRSAL